MKPLSRKNNFLYLFISLLLFLLSGAIVAETTTVFSKGVFGLIVVLMLIASIRSLHTDKSWKYIIFFLVPVFVTLNILEHIFTGKVYIFLVLITLLVFFIGIIIKAFHQVLFEGDIDANKLIGSLTLYMLLGLVWTVVYMIIVLFDPAAFSGIETTSWQAGFSRMAYYSFVTLTTLGYGDILPKNHIAEFFAYMEAVIGVFYMAIIVSSLISLRLNSISKKRS